MTELYGGCHCGNLRFSFETARTADALTPNACDCSFCRKHGTRALSDPAGLLAITVGDPDQLGRYRFGTGFTDFLICRRCGVYIGAFMPEGAAGDALETGFANAMADALDDPGAIVRPATAVRRSDEDADARRARRRANWTPATLTVRR